MKNVRIRFHTKIHEAKYRIRFRHLDGQELDGYLNKTNDKCEWLCSFYWKFIMTGFFVATVGISATTILICRISHGNFDAEYLYLPIKLE